jgi:membrane protease YdiL (CAAX protease family)
MIVTRRVAWIVLIAAILTAGILRQFHARIPSSPYLPAPFSSLLFFLLVILGLVFARGWGRRQEVPYAGPGLTRVNFLALIPLLIALMLEKWVSITFYDPLFSRIDDAAFSPEMFNRLFVLESGLGLLLVCVLLLPLFRRLMPLLGRYLSPRRLPEALVGLAVAVTSLYLALWLLFALFGGEGVHLRWSGFGRGAALVLAGQAVVAFAEEVYYRGILQSETNFLLPALGIEGDRARSATAILLVSTSFALEHFVLAGVPGVDARLLLFPFAASLLLGYMLVLTRSLWFCAGCHFLLNLFALSPAGSHRGLQFVDDQARPLLTPQTYIFLFFVMSFVLIYLREAIGRRRRAPLPVAERP